MKLAIRRIFFIITTCTLLASCAKEYSSETPLAPDGSWQFSQGISNYAGTIQSVYSTNGGGTSNQLMLTGKSNDGKQAFEITVYADSIQTGTYKASEYQSYFIYGSSANPIYQATGSYGEFIVNVTKLQGSSIAGNFSGTARDSTGNSVTITNGKFQVQ